MKQTNREREREREREAFRANHQEFAVNLLAFRFVNVMYDFNRIKTENMKKKKCKHTYTFPSSNKNTQMQRAIAAHNELGHTISIFSCFVWAHHDACVIAQDINASWELLLDLGRGRPHLHTYIHTCMHTCIHR